MESVLVYLLQRALNNRAQFTGDDNISRLSTLIDIGKGAMKTGEFLSSDKMYGQFFKE